MGDINFDWALILSFVEALAWPIVALIALFFVRPLVRDIINAFLTKGGTFKAFGIEAELKNSERVEKAVESVAPEKAAQPQNAELERFKVSLRAMDDEELYYVIMDEWAPVKNALNEAYYLKTGEGLDWRSGHWSKSEVKKAGLLNEAKAEALDYLFEIRSSAKRRGPSGFEGMGLDAEDVFKYVVAARSLATEVAAAMERHRQ